MFQRKNLFKNFVMFNKINFFSSRGKSGGGSERFSSITETLESKRVNFFNNFVEQRRQLGSVDKLTELNVLPVIIQNDKKVGNPVLRLSDFQERYSEYKSFNQETVASPVNNAYLTIKNGLSSSNLLVLNNNVSSSSYSGVLSYTNRDSKGSPLEITPKTKIYNLDPNATDVGGIYTGAKVIPVSKEDLIDKDENFLYLSEMISKSMKAHGDFKTATRNSPLVEREVKLLENLSQQIMKNNNVNFQSIIQYKKDVQLNRVTMPDSHFTSLDSVLNFFSTSALEIMLTTFSCELRHSSLSLSAFALFVQSFRGLWIMVLPVVDLAMVPIDVFHNRLKLRVCHIITERGANSSKGMVNTIFTNSVNFATRCVERCNMITQATLNDFKNKIIDKKSKDFFAIVSSSFNYAYETVSDFVWNSIFDFVWKKRYYFVVGGIFGLSGILVFTSSGTKIINFFKSSPIRTLPVIENPVPLDSLTDLHIITKVVEQVSVNSGKHPILGIHQYFFENFTQYSAKIDSIFLFLSNHLQ